MCGVEAANQSLKILTEKLVIVPLNKTRDHWAIAFRINRNEAVQRAAWLLPDQLQTIELCGSKLVFNCMR